MTTKHIYIALSVPILFLSGMLIGLEWGLASKPRLDMSQCDTIIRYEDGSVDCDPDAHDTLDVGENTGMQNSENVIQNTISDNALQPARGE